MLSKNNIARFAMIFALVYFIGPSVHSQSPTVDAQTKDQLKVIMAHLLETVYVSPEIGKQLSKQLKARFESGAYNEITNPTQLADTLTRDLREVNNDKHLSLRYDPATTESATILTQPEWETIESSMFPRESSSPQPGQTPSGLRAPGAPELSARMANQLQQANYHFREAKYLSGNIGYLKLDGFAPGQAARDTAAKTMATLAGSDAMIIDLRRCPGGTSEMVNFLASYFFDKEPRVLMSRYIRPTGETIQSKTVSDIPGKRMLDTDIYILVSADTASACESFSYTLQQYGRAKVVGERTAGAGYNNVIIPLGKGYSFSVSFGRPTHPRSGKGWEGEGVQPDIAVSADQALLTAQSAALQTLIGRTADDNRKRELTFALQDLTRSRDNASPVASPSVLQDFIGRYGNKEISVKDGGLYYQRIGGRGAALRATGKDKFALNTDAQIDFLRDASGVVTEMIIEWVDRDKEQLRRETPVAINQSNIQSPNQTQTQQRLSQAEQEVRKLEREWLDAYEQHDAAAMDRIVADDFKLTQSGGGVQTKADILAALKSPRAAGRAEPKFSTADVESRVEGDTVILTGRFIQQMERDGQTRTMEARYTDTYAKRQGRWQVVASQLTRLLQR
jgi:ketosteroid isomerase-like protein